MVQVFRAVRDNQPYAVIKTGLLALLLLAVVHRVMDRI